MARTVPKTVAKAGGATNKRTANRKARFIKSLSPEKDQSRGIRAAVGSDQRRLGEMAARQPPAERNRGGGERGSRERGKSNAFANSIDNCIAADAPTSTDGGSTTAIAVTSHRPASSL